MNRSAARPGARALLPLLALYPWSVPLIIVLGVLASLAEGLGLSLFIPLLRSLDGTVGEANDTWWAEALNRLFLEVDQDDRLVVISLCIFAFIVIRALLSYLNGIVFAWLDTRISHGLRSAIFDQLLGVEYRFIERTRFGDLLNTLATETWRTSEALSVLVTFIITVCSVAVYVTLLLLLSVRLTLAVGVAMLLISGIVRLLTRRVRSLGGEATRANARLSERMVEGLAMMPVIRTFNRERYEKDRFDAHSKRVSSVSMRLSIVSGLVTPVYEVLAGALLVGVMIVTLDDAGKLTSLLLFIFVLYRLQPMIARLDGARVNLRGLSAAVEDVMRLVDRSDKPYLSEGTTAHRGLRRSIDFHDVTFRYERDEPAALEHVSLAIPAGRVTALVGPSGAGKSTLIKLIFRFYDPGDGVITVDGQPLRELDLVSWRDRLALVSQEVQLFNATIRENIAYGRPGATDQEIEEAARRADAHDFIARLPEGYETEVGDNGVRLSGGQQQRITFARAVIRDPEVLILDEATNALDSRSERIIQDALDLLSHDRTVIVIAHRFSTIERADHIVVLDEGRVSEGGDRATLLANGGLFRRLHELQHDVS